MAKHPGQMMVVEPDIAGQCGLQILGTIESMSGQDLGDATVETLDPAMGLGRARMGQAMCEAQGLAEWVEFVRPRRLTVLGTKQPVCERFAVIGQDRPDS